jgi:tRNA dimethylallyltransferase
MAPSFMAIVGPTASGKTGLSLEVGRRLAVEVISMDSRQIYRGMDVGTGKVTLRERAILPHHGLDLRDPDERYSAGQFARDAKGWIRDIRGRGRVPLLVGGTGFFLRALVQPLFLEPDMDRDRLERLRTFLNGLPMEELARHVEVLEPERASEARKGGRQRLTRAVEVAFLTGRTLSAWHQGPGEGEEKPLRGVVVLLALPRETLYERINRRVGRMLEEGWVEEVEGLLEGGYGPEDPGMTGAGYREIVRFLREDVELEETAERIRRSHRQYARRQVTWYRHQLGEGVLTLDGTRPVEELARCVVEAWEGSEAPGSGRGSPSRNAVGDDAPFRNGTVRDAPSRNGTFRDAPSRNGTVHDAPSRNE